jgi:serine/threonine protein kinase/DNA-binding LacI/PurR family transcriptional regulator
VLTDQLIGKTIDDDFVIKERLGQGGMAQVYRARQLSVNRDVALKIINLHEAQNDENFRQRFANEAAIIASLEHLHILPVYAYGIYEDHAYLAMRLLRGGTLKDRLREGQPLPIADALHLFEQIAKGLGYAHSKGIIHRDIKPANILLDENNNAYLTDFGLAKVIDSDEHLTRGDSVVGTLAYMSPEQLQGERIDHRSDLYGLGVVLYHMLCGRVPFRGETQNDMVAVIYMHIQEDPPPPSQFNSEISPELEMVIFKAMSKEPASRYSSADEFARDVRLAMGVSTSGSTASLSPMALLERTGSTQTRRTTLPKPPEEPKPTPFLTPRRLAYTAITLLVVLVGVGLFAMSQRFVPPPPYTLKVDDALSYEEVIPSQAQIDTAHAVLGSDGFIALLPCNRTSEYHATLTRETQEFARVYGLAIRIYDSNTDAYQQRLELERALTEGAKAVIICPLDVDLLEETLQAIRDQHIPLTSIGPDLAAFGGVHTAALDYEMGMTVGQMAGRDIVAEKGGKARVLILDYPDLEVIVQRVNGLEDGVKATAPDVTIVGRVKGAVKEFAYESVKNALEDGLEFDVILSLNDAGSYGAVDALEEAGLAPDSVWIYSMDAERLALDYIRDGRFIRATLQVARTQSAQTIVDLTTIMLAGGTVPATVYVPAGDMISADNLDEGKS